MDKQLKEINLRLSKELFEAKTTLEIMQIKSRYLGKNGEISALLATLRNLSGEERAAAGAKINTIKTEAENAIMQTEQALKDKELNERLISEKIDVTLNKKGVRKIGSLHPLTIDNQKLCRILCELGFRQIDGPEVEEDKYNFEMLNMPKGHPARDMQDTFYITENILLRTHTSPSQARIMEKVKPPIKVFCPGRVFRIDELDATHSPAFYQIEGLYVDENVSMADLKKTLLIIMKNLLGEDTQIRFRASYFPFTEPSVEVDATCNLCGGKGCAACKHAGWIEMLGAGMVHPKVLEFAGIDSTKYSGYAFGLGPDRLAKLNYKLSDLRTFYFNDIRFLKQFEGKN